MEGGCGLYLLLDLDLDLAPAGPAAEGAQHRWREWEAEEKWMLALACMRWWFRARRLARQQQGSSSGEDYDYDYDYAYTPPASTDDVSYFLSSILNTSLDATPRHAMPVLRPERLPMPPPILDSKRSSRLLVHPPPGLHRRPTAPVLLPPLPLLLLLLQLSLPPPPPPRRRPEQPPQHAPPRRPPRRRPGREPREPRRPPAPPALGAGRTHQRRALRRRVLALRVKPHHHAIVPARHPRRRALAVVVQLAPDLVGLGAPHDAARGRRGGAGREALVRGCVRVAGGRRVALVVGGVGDEAEAGDEGAGGHGGRGLLGAEAPAQGQDAGEEDGGAEGDEGGGEGGQEGGLVEVDEAVEDGDDVVDAEDERVEHGRRHELEAAVEVVELRQGEGDQAKEDGPGLPAVELVFAVEERAHEELDRDLGNEERVC